jgi:hypothetical protein
MELQIVKEELCALNVFATLAGVCAQTRHQQRALQRKSRQAA